MNQLHTHRILILGLGREGLSSYRFLRHHLPQQPLWLYDDAALATLDPAWNQALDQDPQAHLLTELKSIQDISPTLVVKTPGLPPTHPVLELAHQHQVQLTSNAQLFFDSLNTLPGPVTTIGVTGTKGKSTTTSLIHHVLTQAGKTAWLGGNIGVPPLDLLPDLTQAMNAETNHGSSCFVVLELSSHQLLDLHTSPQIAVVQNIVPEHLDYYATFEAYVDAKSHLTCYQKPEDVVVFNPTHELPTQLANLSPAHHLPFTIETNQTHLLYQGQPVIALTDIPLPGAHNLENVMPSIVIGHHLGIPLSQIETAIHSFKPLAHRLELVGTHHDVQYYNDSLATVQDATVAALEAFAGKPVILLAGGYDRGLDFSELAKAILQHQVKALILFKPTGERIAEAVHSVAAGQAEPSIFFPKSMAEAVHQAAELARPGDVVLMSPASPSFGEFKDYADRGQQFKQAVAQLPS